MCQQVNLLVLGREQGQVAAMPEAGRPGFAAGGAFGDACHSMEAVAFSRKSDSCKKLFLTLQLWLPWFTEDTNTANDEIP